MPPASRSRGFLGPAPGFLTEREYVVPIYEFRCQKCEHVFEELVPSSQTATIDTAVRCERCESEDVVRLLSGFAVNAAGETRRPPSPAGPCGPSCACFPPD